MPSATQGLLAASASGTDAISLTHYNAILKMGSPRPLGIRAMGIRDRPTAPRSPWQNGYAERLIGSIRRECLDHVVIIGERHLRHVLRSYQQYYNGTRTHLSLGKDSPLTRSVQPRGTICPLPILGGLHHHYVRI